MVDAKLVFGHLRRALFGPAVSLVLFSIFCLAVGVIVSLVVQDHLASGQPLGKILGFLVQHGAALFEFGGMLFVLGVTLNVIVLGIHEVWSDSASKTFSGGFASIGSSIVENLKPIAQSVQHQKLDQLLRYADENELKAALPRLISRLHGPHCADQQSLFESVQSTFSPYYGATSPFRASHHKIITVVPEGAHLKWHETSHYNVRCIAFDPNYGGPTPNSIDYRVAYHSNALVDRIKNKEEVNCDLKIGVGSEPVFDFMSAFDIVDGQFQSTNPFLKIQYDGRALDFQFERAVDLTQELTRVEVTEESILSSADTWYNWYTSVPVLGAYISITLPAGYSFSAHNLTNRANWQVRNYPGNVLVAHTDAWIYPGTVFFALWRAPSA